MIRRRRNPPERSRSDGWRVWSNLRDAADKVPEIAEWQRKNSFIIGGVVASVLNIRIPKVNDIVTIPGRGAVKRFIVVRVKGVGFVASAVSGDEKGSLLRGDALNYPIEILRLKPYWTSKTAEKRYADYIDYMKKAGNEGLIVPFTTTEELRPEEEEREAPANDPDPQVTIRHTPQEGTVAIFERNRTIYDALRRFGFVWVPREKVVRRTQSIGIPKTTAPVHTIKAVLNQQGIRVAFDLQRAETEEDIAAANERRRQYLLDRAERMRQGSLRAAERAQQYAERSGEGAKSLLSKLNIEGYYPTPGPIVGQVIAEAEIEEGDNVLEPSAGTGALADGAKAVGGEIDAVEKDPHLATYLRSLGYPIVGTDILRFAPGPIYDVAVMNPPFENGQDIDHVRHVFGLLKPGGRLVSIMSEGPFFRQDRKASAFREWLDTKTHSAEKLPPTTYGRATVNTRLVVIDKAEGDESAPMNEQQIAEIARARQEAEGESGRAAEIASDLISRAGTSRRAARSLETAKRKAKEQSAYARDLEQRARGIERAAERVGQVEPESPGWKVGDAVFHPIYRVGVILRVLTDSIKVRFQSGEARKVRLGVYPLQEAIAAGYVSEEEAGAPTSDKPLREQLIGLIRSRVKRDTGATLSRSDVNGWAIGFGKVTEGWHGKRAEVEYGISVGRDQVNVYDGRGGYGRTPKIIVPFEGRSAQEIYQDFADRLKATVEART